MNRRGNRHDGVHMLETPYTFSDGDMAPIYLTETPRGTLILSDRGHTLMRASYLEDVPAEWLNWAILQAGLLMEDGVFSVEIAPAHLEDAGLRFGEALVNFIALCQDRA